MEDILELSHFTDRDLMEAILGSYFILDYGYVLKVNADDTIDVAHAKYMKDRTGKNLPRTETPNVEVLTYAGEGFSIKWDINAGDKVLLLGLKDYISKVDDVTKTTDKEVDAHYYRAGLKAIPLCVFNDDAKVKFEIDNGKLTITAKDDTEVKSDANIKLNAGSGKKIELNGNSKQFVTWSELDNALTSFLTQLTTALTTTPIVGNGATQPTWSGLPTSIDISSAKTTSVVTGG